MQNCDSQKSQGNISAQFSIVNNLNGCLKGWGRRETVTAVGCLFPSTFKDPLNVPDMMRRVTTSQTMMIVFCRTSFPSFARGQYWRISYACYSFTSRVFWVLINTNKDTCMFGLQKTTDNFYLKFNEQRYFIRSWIRIPLKWILLFFFFAGVRPLACITHH